MLLWASIQKGKCETLLFYKKNFQRASLGIKWKVCDIYITYRVKYVFKVPGYFPSMVNECICDGQAQAIQFICTVAHC